MIGRRTFREPARIPGLSLTPWLLGFGLLTACAPEASETWVPYPPTGQAASMLLAVYDGDQLLRLQAHDLDVPRTIRLPEDGAERSTVRLEALLYAQTLEAMGLQAGVIEEAQPDARHSRSLGGPRTSFALELSEPHQWTQTASPSDRLSDLKVPLECGVAHVRTVGVPSSTDIELLFSVPNGPLLVSVEEPTLFSVEGERVQEVSVVGGGVPCAAARFEGSNELWLGSCFGGIYRGSLIGGRLMLSLVAWTSERVHSLAGRIDPTTGRPEIFILGYYGAFERYDGVSITLLHDFDRGTSNNKSLGGLALVGPGEAIAAMEATTEIAHYRDGQLRLEPTPSTSGFTSVAHSPGLGTLLGTADGSVLLAREGRNTWEPIEDLHLGRWMSAIAPIEGGFVFGTAFGSAGYYLESLGVCGPELIAAFNINHVTAHGGLFALGGDNPNASESPVTFLELR